MLVSVETYTHTISSEYSPEKYGDWSEERQGGVASVVYGERSGYGFTNFDVPVKAGEPVYVLLLAYGSGDSFGHASGNIDLVYVFSSRDLADKARLLLEQTSNWSEVLDIGDGRTFTYSCPHVGYFECLENIEILEFIPDSL